MATTADSALPYYRQLISLRLILNNVGHLQWLLPRVAEMGRRTPPAEAFLERFEPLLSNLTKRQATALRIHLTESIAEALLPDDFEPLDKRDWEKLTKAVERWRKGGPRPGGHSPLETSVHAMMRRLNAKIARVPPGIEKALDFLEAYVALCPVSSCDCLAELVCLHRYERDISPHLDRVLRELRTQYRKHLDDAREQHLPHLHIFWTSDHSYEQWDDFQFLVFGEHFRPADFTRTMSDVRRLVEWWVIEAGWTFDFRPRSVEVRSGIDMALRLWPLIDVPSACQSMRPALDLMLRSLVQYQHRDDFWFSPDWDLPEGQRPAASAEATAAAVCLIGAYGRRPAVRDALNRGVNWLLANQHHDGYWFERAADGSANPSTLATCLAIRGLLRTSTIDVRDPVHRGTRWLLSQQSPAGDWGEGESLVIPRAETLLVLNMLWESTTLMAKSQVHQEYLDVALGLAERALEHLAQEDETSLQIAVVLAFQAAEAFLYSCLVTVNQNVFKAGGNETIGFRKALARLEEHLRSEGDLKRGQVLKGRSDIDRLKYLRDQVVHKAVVVHVSDGRPAVEAGVDLIRRFCMKFHGFQPVNL